MNQVNVIEVNDPIVIELTFKRITPIEGTYTTEDFQYFYNDVMRYIGLLPNLTAIEEKEASAERIVVRVHAMTEQQVDTRAE